MGMRNYNDLISESSMRDSVQRGNIFNKPRITGGVTAPNANAKKPSLQDELAFDSDERISNNNYYNNNNDSNHNHTNMMMRESDFMGFDDNSNQRQSMR
jgi:hypothetical protein